MPSKPRHILLDRHFKQLRANASTAYNPWESYIANIGGYLRAPECTHGVFVVGFVGGKSYWLDPVSSEHLSFEEVMLRLEKRATELEIGHRGHQGHWYRFSGTLAADDNIAGHSIFIPQMGDLKFHSYHVA